jgi:hypothetical protein
LKRQAKLLCTAALLCLLSAIGASGAAADTPPAVTIAAPSAVSYTSAHVAGTVDPEGGPSSTFWYFQYSSEPSNPFSWSFAGGAFGEISGSEAEGTSPLPVGGELEGLQPGTEYSVRLIAENGEGANRSETAAPYPSFTTEAVAPPLVSLDPITTFTGTTAQFNATIDPQAPAGNPPAFDVNWHFSCQPGCPTAEAPSQLPADGSSHPVSVEANSLLPNTDYEVTLAATNAGGTIVAGPESFKTAPMLPEVEAAGASSTGTEASLSARVNPRNAATKYHFEYGRDAGYGLSTPERIIAPVNSPVQVSAQIEGLLEGGDYHFRIVATNVAGTTEGPDRSFATPVRSVDTCPNATIRARQDATFLANCRAYEMVSPADKSMGDINFTSSRSRSSTDGNVATFASQAAFAGSASAPSLVQYLSRRGMSGWSVEAISPPQDPNSANVLRKLVYQEFTDDLSAAILDAQPPVLAPGAAVGTNNIYRQDLGTNAFQTVTTKAPPTANVLFYQPYFAGASADLSHVIFESTGALTPDAPEDGLTKLYESVEGEIRLAGLLPDETPPPAGSIAAAGVSAFSGFQYAERLTNHAISTDGETIFFTVPEEEGTYEWGQPGQIYARIGGERTVHASASQRSTPDPAGPKPAFYRGAAADGSSVTFTTAEQLLDLDDNDSTDLYRYDVPSGGLELLSPDAEPADGLGAEVVGVIGSSRDGDRAYFVANGQLEAGAPTDIGYKLYFAEGGAARFVAELDPSDDVGDTVRLLWSPRPRARGARVSADGRYLLFTSIAPQPGYDNGGKHQIYLYDAQNRAIKCASCPRDGVAPPSEAFITQTENGVAANFVSYESRALSADGRKVFFATGAALLPNDVNGMVDVYEYDVPADRVSLVSSGTSDKHSYFLDASPDGSDVFIVTRGRLIAADRDERYDMYDVRVGGGFPEPQSPAPACEGEACQGAPAAPAGARALSSASVGAGNQSRSKRCKTVRTRGKKQKARCGQRRKKQRAGGKSGKRRAAKGRAQTTNKGGAR